MPTITLASDITKEKFLRYEEVRKLGITNMFAVSNVTKYAKLTQDEVLDIMKNYSSYRKQFLGV